MLKKGEQSRHGRRIFPPPLNDVREEELVKLSNFSQKKHFCFRPPWAQGPLPRAVQPPPSTTALLQRDCSVPSSTSPHQLFAPKRSPMELKAPCRAGAGAWRRRSCGGDAYMGHSPASSPAPYPGRARAWQLLQGPLVLVILWLHPESMKIRQCVRKQMGNIIVNCM